MAAVTLIYAYYLSDAHESASENSEIASEHKLWRGIDSFPETLDAQKYISNQALAVLRDIGEGLVSFRSDGALVPGAAKSWEVSEDGLTYTFRLRENLRYSSGEPIVAQHFKNAFVALFDADSAAPSRGYFSIIEGASATLNGDADPKDIGVEVIATDSLRIKLASVTPYFLELLTLPVTFPILEMDGKYVPSNGPYVVEKNNAPFSIELTRNTEYWNDSATSFDRVVFLQMEPEAETRAFLAGELDITSTVAAGQHERLRKERPEELKVGPGLGVFYVGISMAAEPLNRSSAIRAALGAVIDRDEIVEKVTKRGEVPAMSFVPPGISGYASPQPEFLKQSLSARISNANAILKEAGYSPETPLSFTLDYYSSGLVERVALAIKKQWEEHLPVSIELNSQEPRLYVSKLRTPGEIEAFIGLWTGDFRDPSAFLKLFSSDHPNNFSYFDDKSVETLLGQSASESDVGELMALYQQVEGLIQKEVPVIPIYYPVSKRLVASDIAGFSSNPLNVVLSSSLYRVGDTE